ncbi:MAG: DUF465 domain-containing protein [Gammaproteobacteria bacterium]|jgi:hypothetical protein|nr:DUF465 domain-containing protein [Gammaproteobacteria bacterium]
MLSSLSDEEIRQIKTTMIELELEHHDLNMLIERLVREPGYEELYIKRLKKHKLQLKDQLVRLADRLIPDILA